MSSYAEEIRRRISSVQIDIASLASLYNVEVHRFNSTVKSAYAEIGAARAQVDEGVAALSARSLAPLLKELSAFLEREVSRESSTFVVVHRDVDPRSRMLPPIIEVEYTREGEALAELCRLIGEAIRGAEGCEYMVDSDPSESHDTPSVEPINIASTSPHLEEAMDVLEELYTIL